MDAIFKSSKGQTVYIIVTLVIIFTLNATSIPRKSLTHDEPAHFEYGLKVMLGDSNRFDDSKMPFSVFNALAAAHDLDVDAPFLNMKFKNLQRARLVTSFFSLLLALLIYHWARRLYGVYAAMLSVLTYAFAPNVLAHSRLVTSDLYAALMTTVTLYTFWRFMKEGGWKWATAAAASLGAAQVAKYPCVLLCPILLLILLIRFGPHLKKAFHDRDRGKLKGYSKRFLVFVCQIVVVGLVVINIGFLFNRSFTRLRDYEFKSNFFQSLQQSGLGSLPVPVPYPYLEGLDWVRDIERRGGTSGNLYLLGERRQNQNFPSYYFVAFLFKVPLGLQALLLFSVLLFFKNKENLKTDSDEIFLVVPFAFFFIYLSFFYRTQVGIRHLLIVFPLLFIFIGKAARDWEMQSNRLRASVAGLILYQIVSVLSYHPHYIPYFNELVWNRSNSYRILADSNLDWGQDKILLKEYLEKNPEALHNPERPTAGRIVIRANLLCGVFDPEKYAWLRDNFEPVDNIAYSYLIFDIKPERLEELGLAQAND